MIGLKENKLSQLLDQIFGKGTISKDESIHFCPFCKHYKKKLQINLQTHQFHCWTCDIKGRNIYSLFKKVKASNIHFEKLRELYPEKTKKNENIFKVSSLFNIDENELFEENSIKLFLPEGFIPLWEKSKGLMRKAALDYLKFRGVTKEDIIKYNIGYSEEGNDFEYKNKIIIPSYDGEGILNFFAGRNFTNDSKFPHRLAPIKKNIVGFELFINWTEPLYICEGAFDAIGIKRNSIPLFGKIISNKLIYSIVEKEVSRIYLVLDNDAIKSSLDIFQKLEKLGVEVYITELDKKDPSEIGFKKMETILNNTKPMNFLNFIKMKLKNV